jgi:predicted DNA-binding WGR domain protein
MMITLYRIDEHERIRYYSISDRQGDLFSSYTFTVSWGLAVSAGQERVYAFDSQEEMDGKLREFIARRLKSGYRVLYTFFRTGEYRSLQGVLRGARAS